MSRPSRVQQAAWRDLDPLVAYDIARLRVEVFVVEQGCPYPELDGRDVEDAARHLWVDDVHGVASYLRVLAEPDGCVRVGRVCTRRDARGRGLSALLLDAAVAGFPGRDVVANAQAHLAAWYARRGFVVDGPGHVEDGIPHLPLRRPAGAAPAARPGTSLRSAEAS